MNQDIEKAIYELRNRAGRYAKTERYYDGNHDLAFATEKFQNTFGTLFREFALNLCPVICDAVRDKLRVTGFSVDAVGNAGTLACTDAGASGNNAGAHDRDAAGSGVAGRGACVPGDTRRIWHRNRMGTRAGEVHKEALKNGDAYAIVWPNARGEAVFYPNRAANISVVYDDDSPGRILRAAKYWRTADKYIRLNLFYPDRIEKYISRTTSEGSLPDAKDFAPLGSKLKVQSSRLARNSSTLNFELETLNSDSVVPNPFGLVPVFHFANNADIGMPGRSELDAAIPVQDGLNKSVLDMLVAMEYSAFRQRWVAGIEVETDANGKAVPPFKNGVDTLWVAGDANTRFGDFEAAQLDQFLKVKDSFRVDIASITGTPLHYLLQNTGGVPSGESLKKAETRFIAKVRDRQDSFGQVWSDVMAFALVTEGRGKDVRLITEWEDPAPMSEREVLENILLKKQIGLPVEQALLEAGYGEADVKRMRWNQS